METRSGLNASESAVAAKHIAAGRRVLHRGAPDLLILEDGKPPRFCEVKTGKDDLTREQKEWRKALMSLGAAYEVCRMEPPTVHVSIYLSDHELSRLEAARPRDVKRSTYLVGLIEDGLLLRARAQATKPFRPLPKRPRRMGPDGGTHR